MDFDRFEAWERGQDAQAQVKKKQSSSSKEYGGIAMQYGLSKKAALTVEKKRKSSSHSQSKKHKNCFQDLADFGIKKECDKRSKVEKWLIENEFKQSKQSEITPSFSKSHSNHPPILIDSGSSMDESHKENKKKRKEVKKEEDSDDSHDFSPRSQKKMKPQPKKSEHRTSEVRTKHRNSSTNSQDTSQQNGSQYRASAVRADRRNVASNSRDIFQPSATEHRASAVRGQLRNGSTNSQDTSPPTGTDHKARAVREHATVSMTSRDFLSSKHNVVRRTVSAPEGIPMEQPIKAQNNLFENVFMKQEKMEEQSIDTANIKKEFEEDQPSQKKVHVHIKKEVKSPPKTAVRPASFILKPKGDDVCVQTDIDTNTLRDLLNCADQLPPQLKNETRYKWTVKFEDNNCLHKTSRKLNNSKGNDLSSWYTYLLDNYKSKREYSGEEDCSCFITLNSRYEVMQSSRKSAEVEVLNDGSNEDNWMRNIRDPIRVYNFIDRPFYAQHIGQSLSDKLPEIIITRIFPPDVS